MTRVVLSGYRATCEECPWKGPQRLTSNRASADARRHDLDKHDEPDEENA